MHTKRPAFFAAASRRKKRRTLLSMSSADEQRLVALLLDRHFGSQCARVGCLLVKKGRSSLAQIAALLAADAATVTPIKSIKEALFVLVHHFVVFWREVEERGKRTAFYSLHVPSLFVRLTFPAIIESVCAAFPAQREIYGEEMKYLLLHARVPIKHYTTETQKAFVEDLRRKTFVEVIFLPPAAASNTEKVANEHPPSFDAASIEKKGFGWQKTNADSAASKGAVKKTVKRKLAVDSDEEDNGTAAFAASNSTTQLPTPDCFLRANLLKLVCALRNAAVVQHFARKYNESCGAVFGALLDLDLGNAPNQLVSFLQLERAMAAKAAAGSNPLTPFDECAAMNTLLAYDAAPASGTLLAKYIEVIVADVSGVVVRRDASAGGLFAVDQRAIDRLLASRTLHSLVLERHGATAARIFNLLRIENAVMDEKMICKNALTDVKETRETLVRLLKHGFVSSQEIPRTPDHMPSRTFFMWRFVEQQGARALRHHAVKTLGNLLVRSRLAFASHRLLIAKTQRSDVRENPSLLSAAEQAMLRSLHKNTDQIDFYVVKVAEMLFTAACTP